MFKKDELVNAYSIAFDSTGSKIYCGYKKSIKIFDISLPGKNFQDVKLFGTVFNKKTLKFKFILNFHSKDDQYKMPGIVSCIAFSKAQNGVYAAGSYTKYSLFIYKLKSLNFSLKNTIPSWYICREHKRACVFDPKPQRGSYSS